MKHNRQTIILEMLKKEDFVTTEALAIELDVSTQTIRRDLDALEEQGLVNKVYGGASLAEGAGETKERSLLDFLPFTENMKEKQGIAAKAIDFVRDGTTIAIDIGSTTRMLAPELSQRNNLLIITKDTLLAASLYNHPTNKVVLIGGLVDETGTTAGDFFDEFLNKVSVIDTFFLSTEGITVNEGLTSSRSGIEAYRTSILARAKHKIALVDHSKFGSIGFYRTCGIEDLDMIITDNQVDDKIIKEIHKAGVEIIKTE